MNLPPELAEAIQRQVAFQCHHMLDIMWSGHTEGLAMLDKRRKKLTDELPMLWGRRMNDIYAAAYMHCVAYDEGNGDDCVDWYGNEYEVKLTGIRSRDLCIGANGALLHKGSEGAKKGKSLFDRCRTKWKVFDKTAAEHHNQTTGYILVSEDHKCFIDGFIMHGDAIVQLLANGEAVDRSISLGQFMTYGYRFPSSVPHIGWERYQSALDSFVRAKYGMLTPEESQIAIHNWVTLADPEKLKRA